MIQVLAQCTHKYGNSTCVTSKRTVDTYTPNLINIGHELRNLNAITNVANVAAMPFSDKYLADVTSIKSAKGVAFLSKCSNLDHIPS